MSPELTAQDTALMARSSTSREIPASATPATSITRFAATFERTVEVAETAGPAFAAATAGADGTAAAGAADMPSIAVLSRQTIVPMSRLAARPFTRLTSRNVFGVDSHIKGWSGGPQAEQLQGLRGSGLSRTPKRSPASAGPNRRRQ